MLAKVSVVTSTQVDIRNKAASVHQHIVEELSLETRKPHSCKLSYSRGMQPQGALGWALGETFGLCLREETKYRAKRGSVSSGNPTAVIIQSVLEAFSTRLRRNPLRDTVWESGLPWLR